MVEFLCQIRVQNVINQRGFAGAGHAGDADKAAQRNIHIQVLEVVLRGAANPEEVSAAGAPRVRDRNMQPAR